MKILLISPAQPSCLYSMTEVADITGCRGYMTNIALPTLAALTPSAVELTIVDEVTESLDPYLQQQWDVVGVTGYVTHRQRMLEIADAFRGRAGLVAIGGPYATLSAETVRPHADVLFIGEAEHTWPAFLADLRAGSWKAEYRATATVDLDATPLPAMPRVRGEDYLIGVVQTSRGCPFECEFCDVIIYLGRRQRYKAPARIVEELEQLYALGYRNLFLADDNFTASRKQARAIVAAIGEWARTKSERIAIGTQLSIDVARDPELLDLLAAASVRQVFIGIETPSHDALREVKKRQNVRADLIADVRLFQQRGIAVQAGIITGFDADTPASFGAQFAFLQAAGIPAVLVNMLMAPEGTPLEARLRAENRLRTLRVDDGFTSTNIIPKHMTTEQLHAGTQWLLNKLYAPEAFLERVAVLAAQSPPATSGGAWSPARYAAIWQNLARAYERLGPDFRRVPREAVKLFRGKDTSSLGTALIFHVHNVRVLQHQGLWDPGLAQQTTPDCALPVADDRPVREAPRLL